MQGPSSAEACWSPQNPTLEDIGRDLEKQCMDSTYALMGNSEQQRGVACHRHSFQMLHLEMIQALLLQVYPGTSARPCPPFYYQQLCLLPSSHSYPSIDHFQSSLDYSQGDHSSLYSPSSPLSVFIFLAIDWPAVIPFSLAKCYGHFLLANCCAHFLRFTLILFDWCILAIF